MGKIGWMVLVAVLCAGAAAADDPEGWVLGRNGDTCEADSPQADGSIITIAAMGPQYLVLLQNLSFPLEKQSRTIAVSIDGAPALPVDALVSDHIYGIAVTPTIGIPLRGAAKLEAVIAGQAYRFDVRHADQAMDAVAACAHIPKLPDLWNEAPKPLAGAPGWSLVEHVPGTNRCSVRRNSPEVNTSLILSNEDKLVLIAGRPDWARWGGEIKAALEVDDGPAVELSGGVFQNIVLFALKDEPALEQKLPGAKALTWHLPWGTFHGAIEGFGVAVAALRQCEAGKAKG
jgi:hypothetical protein